MYKVISIEGGRKKKVSYVSPHSVEALLRYCKIHNIDVTVSFGNDEARKTLIKNYPHLNFFEAK